MSRRGDPWGPPAPYNRSETRQAFRRPLFGDDETEETSSNPDDPNTERRNSSTRNEDSVPENYVPHPVQQFPFPKDVDRVASRARFQQALWGGIDDLRNSTPAQKDVLLGTSSGAQGNGHCDTGIAALQTDAPPPSPHPSKATYSPDRQQHIPPPMDSISILQPQITPSSGNGSPILHQPPLSPPSENTHAPDAETPLPSRAVNGEVTATVGPETPTSPHPSQAILSPDGHRPPSPRHPPSPLARHPITPTSPQIRNQPISLRLRIARPQSPKPRRVEGTLPSLPQTSERRVDDTLKPTSCYRKPSKIWDMLNSDSGDEEQPQQPFTPDWVLPKLATPSSKKTGCGARDTSPKKLGGQIESNPGPARNNNSSVHEHSEPITDLTTLPKTLQSVLDILDLDMIPIRASSPPSAIEKEDTEWKYFAKLLDRTIMSILEAFRVEMNIKKGYLNNRRRKPIRACSTIFNKWKVCHSKVKMSVSTKKWCLTAPLLVLI